MAREKRSSVEKRAVAGTLTLSNPSYASKLPRLLCAVAVHD